MKTAIQEFDEAFEWLDLAVNKKDIMLMCLPSFDWWDLLRKHARFNEVLNKTGLTEYLNTYKPISIDI